MAKSVLIKFEGEISGTVGGHKIIRILEIRENNEPPRIFMELYQGTDHFNNKIWRQVREIHD